MGSSRSYELRFLQLTGERNGENFYEQGDDTHSIRHTHGHTHGHTLGEAGLSQKDIMASLHHSRSSTTDRYTKATAAARQKTVGSLPDVMPLAFKRTGTDEAIAAAVTGPAVTESSQAPRASTRPDAPGGMKKPRLP